MQCNSCKIYHYVHYTACVVTLLAYYLLFSVLSINNLDTNIVRFCIWICTIYLTAAHEWLYIYIPVKRPCQSQWINESLRGGSFLVVPSGVLSYPVSHWIIVLSLIAYYCRHVCGKQFRTRHSHSKHVQYIKSVSLVNSHYSTRLMYLVGVIKYTSFFHRWNGS